MMNGMSGVRYLLILASIIGFGNADAHELSSWLPSSNRRIDEYATFAYDLSQFSLRFEKCQDVKMYDDELAQDGSSNTPLALKHFVVFRLCPTDSCRKCNTVYGKYVLDLATYVTYIVQSEKEAFERNCQACDQVCSNNNNNGNNYNNYNGQSVDCSQCSSQCYQYKYMDDLGIVDTSQFLKCQAVQANNDNNNGNNNQNQYYYIGPRCNQYGKIEIAVFSDQYCSQVVKNANLASILGASGGLWTTFMDHTMVSTEKSCLSCLEQQNNMNEADQYDTDNVVEVCENIYSAASKCESKTGLTNGFIQQNRQAQNYQNQVETEFMACTFVDSLLWNSYTQEGEINYRSKQDMIVRELTKNQRNALALLACVGVCLLGLMEYYRRLILRLIPAPVLSATGATTTLT